MNYTKVEIDSLGEAKIVIERVDGIKPPASIFDGGLDIRRLLRAYDLDE